MTDEVVEIPTNVMYLTTNNVIHQQGKEGTMFVYPLSCEGGINPFWVITGVKFYQTELKPVKRANADANLKTFQHKVHLG